MTQLKKMTTKPLTAMSRMKKLMAQMTTKRMWGDFERAGRFCPIPGSHLCHRFICDIVVKWQLQLQLRLQL
jgi:hypothetical protein